MKVLLFLLSVCLTVATSQSNRLMSTAIRNALAVSFNVTANIVDITVQTNVEDNRLFFLDVLDGVLSENKWNFQVQVDLNNEKFQTTGDFNLWLVDSPDAYRKLYSQIHINKRDSTVYFIIVLRVFHHWDSIGTMDFIFSDLFRLAFVDVSLILAPTSGEILFYTFFPYAEISCRSTAPVLVNQFVGNAFESSDIFPPKSDNFHGCPIRLIGREWIFLLNINRLIKGLDHSGLEGEILLTIAHSFNFTFQVVGRNLEDWFRGIRRNTATGSYKRLEDGEADIMVGFLLRELRTQNLFTTSIPYIFSQLVIALNKPPYKLPKFSWLLSEFDKSTWAYIVLMLAASIVFILLMNHIPKFIEIFDVRRNSLTVLVILESVIGMSIQHLPKRTVLRCCFIIWSIGMLIIRASYQGKMFDSYRRYIYPRPPVTVQELLDDHYTIYTRPEYIGMVEDVIEAMSFSYKNLKNAFVLKNTNRKNAIIGSKFFLYSTLSSIELENVITQQLQAQQATFLFQKHSTLAPKFNMVIESLRESGIIRHLRMRNEFLKRTNLRFKHAKKPQPITFHRFRYLFYSYFCLQLMAVIVFLLEVVWALLRRICRHPVNKRYQ